MSGSTTEARHAPPPRPAPGLRQRLHSLWRRSPFNPYRLDAKLLREGVAELGPRLAGRMIDIGCGERPYADCFPNVNRYVGIEHLGAVINVASAIRVSFSNIDHLVDAFAEGEKLPFLDASFDSCVATEVLEHVGDPAAVVAEVARVLKDDALCLVTVPFVGELHQIPYDYRRYTRFGIEKQFADAGFEVIEMRSRGNFTITAGRVLAHAIYRLGAHRVKADGSVKLHPLAMPIVLPLSALILATFSFFGRFSTDDSLCLGYAVLARRRART
jgi:SAM-dependent methyltransferase